MSTGLGIDLGTTFTSAAISREGTVDVVSLEAGSSSMPSVVAFDGDQVLTGAAAERRMADNPMSGAREFKRRLGDTTPYILDGTPRGAEILTSHLLRAVVDRAGVEPEIVRIAHPANWGEYKLELLRDAGRLADLGEVELVAEPAAAAAHYAAAGQIDIGGLVVVYDFGGGTFDTAVVRIGEAGAEILGRPEGLERLGGVDIDQVVLAHVDACLDGALSRADTSDLEVRRAIVALRVACTGAKEALSADTEVTIPVRLPSLVTEARMTRAELEAAIAPRIDDTLAALDRVVAAAGVDMGDISGVLMVGGSSRIPMVAERVGEHTGRPVLTNTDGETAVSRGAATGTVHATEPVMAMGPASVAPSKTPPGKADGAAAARSTVRPSRLGTIGRAAAAAGVMGAAAGGGYAAWRYFSDEEGERVVEDTVELTSDSSAGTAGSARTENPELGFAARSAATARAGLGDEADVGSEIDRDSVADAQVFTSSPHGRIAAAVFQPTVAAPGPTDTSGPSASTEAHSHAPAPAPPAPVPLAPAASAIVSDPRIEEIRAQLRERLGELSVPEGAEPEDVARLERDLGGLLDRFQPYPGESTDDAVADLRYEFEDRVRDFAQDQRIEAVIEEQRRQIAEAEAVEADVASFQDRLSERLDEWDPPAGADPAEVAELKATLQAMIERTVAIPGQSAEDAIAELRMRFNDQVGDFAQDLKIDALVDEQRADTDDALAEDGEEDAGEPVDSETEVLDDQFGDEAPDASTSSQPDGSEEEVVESSESEPGDSEAGSGAQAEPPNMTAITDPVPAADGSDSVETVAMVDAFDEMMVMDQAVGPEASAADDSASGAVPGVPRPVLQVQGLADTAIDDDVIGGDDFAAVAMEQAMASPVAEIAKVMDSDDLVSAVIEVVRLEDGDEMFMTTSDPDIDGVPDNDVSVPDFPDDDNDPDVDQPFDDPLGVEDQSLDSFDDSDSMTNDGY